MYIDRWIDTLCKWIDRLYNVHRECPKKRGPEGFLEKTG